METINIPDFGTVIILDTYYYYDCPRLFSCESLAGQKYLSIWVDTDDDFDRWFYVPMSNARLRAVHTGKMTPYIALKHPEDGWVWNIITFFDGRASVARLHADEIQDDDLPSKDTIFDGNERELPELEEDPMIVAQREGREVIDLSLIKDHKQEIATHKLGIVLAGYQSLIWNIAYRNGGMRGRIPQQIKSNNTLNAVSLFAASFGVRLKSLARPALFGETDLTPNMELIMALMKSNDKDSLHTILQKIHPRASARYNLFLNSLINNDLELNTSWGSPSEKHDSVYLTKQLIYDTIKLLNEEKDQQIENITIIGILYAINKDRKLFSIKTDKENFSGIISDDILGRDFQIYSNVEANIEITLEVNPMTQEEHEAFKLIGITEL